MRITIPVAVSLLVLAVTATAGAEEVFVPMAVQKQGHDGTWWNTEVWISNTSASTGSYGAVFLPAGQPNGDLLREEVPQEDIGPGVTVYRSDLVPQGALGVLRVVGSPGIRVFARVYNAAGRGSFGEGVAGLPKTAAVRPGEISDLLGLRRTPQFRTNLVMFNPSLDDGVVRLRLLNGRGEVVGEQPFELASGGYIQVDDVLHALRVSRGENLRIEASGTVPFFVFASVIDARSGAPTLVAPIR